MSYAELLPFLFSSYIAGLSGTLPPGPIFTMTLTEAARRGFRAGVAVLLGHMVVEVFVVLVVLLGGGPLLGSPSVRRAIGLVGGLALIWVAQGLLRSVFVSKGTSVEGVKGSLRSPLVNGVIAAAANPYFFIWWGTVGGFLILRGVDLLGSPGAFVFPVLHWGSDVPWFMFVSYWAGKGRVAFGGTLYRWVIAGCGVVLGGLGAYYFLDAVTGSQA